MKQKLLLLLTIILISSSLYAQRIITGVVTDAETGDRIPGASIETKGTTNEAISNLDGEYSIEVVNDKTILYFFL